MQSQLRNRNKKTISHSNYLLMILIAAMVILVSCKAQEKVENQDQSPSIKAIENHSQEATKKIEESKNGIQKENAETRNSAIQIKSTTKEPNSTKEADNIIQNTIEVSKHLENLDDAKKQVDFIKVENAKLKQQSEQNIKVLDEANQKIEYLQKENQKNNEENAQRMRGFMMWIKGIIIIIGVALSLFGFYGAFAASRPEGIINGAIGLFFIGLGMYLETSAIYALGGGAIIIGGYIIYYGYQAIKKHRIAENLIESTQEAKSKLTDELKEKVNKTLQSVQSPETMNFVKKIKEKKK